MAELTLSVNTLEKYKEHIIEAIGEFVDRAGSRGAVLGLSGGIDSAVVGALGKLALNNRLQALIMPKTGVSQAEDIDHAMDFAREFKIPFKVIKINEVIESIKNAYPLSLDSDTGFLARANLAPRIRMLFNYTTSNLEDLIVLGTGNKTELLLGYFTKYGDGGVDFLPIGDLYKTQVKQLACHIGVDECIIDKPPSAGLWHGQTDEDELGETYENIDPVLFHLYDKNSSVGETAAALNIDIPRVERILKMVEKNTHKRNTPPVVKLS